MVTMASREVTERLYTAVSQEIAKSNRWGDTQVHLVSHLVVDGIIAEDAQSYPSSHPKLYILNLPKQSGGRSYFYSYDEEVKSCPGQLWVSDKPYAWVDLTANTSRYGPGTGGKGQVFSHSVPRLDQYPATRRHQAILPDLAALSWSACQHLVWPPLQTSDLPVYREVHVQVMYIYQTLLRPLATVDISHIRSQLEGLGQKVVVEEHMVSFAHCDLCVTAYTRALKSHTGRAPGREFRVESSHFLDTSELQHWLGKYRDWIMAEAGLKTENPREAAVHFLPVFVYQLRNKNEVVMLDGWRQAAALEGPLVVAVQSAGDSPEIMASHFWCQEQNVRRDVNSVTQAVLAAVLQAGWGVADTSLSWSPASGQEFNYLWSLGQSPFSPLSTLSSISFAQKGAAMRNLVMVAINDSLSDAIEVLEGVVSLGGGRPVSSFLTERQQRNFHMRVALLEYKLDQSLNLMQLRQYATALNYATSMEHDARALLQLGKRLSRAVESELKCELSHQWFLWFLPAGSMMITILAIAYRVRLRERMNDRII